MISDQFQDFDTISGGQKCPEKYWNTLWKLHSTLFLEPCIVFHHNFLFFIFLITSRNSNKWSISWRLQPSNKTRKIKPGLPFYYSIAPPPPLALSMSLLSQNCKQSQVSNTTISSIVIRPIFAQSDFFLTLFFGETLIWDVRKPLAM